MADLNDLETKSITEMTPDEAIEHLRQIRLSRRVPVKSAKKTTAVKKKAKVKAVPKLTSAQADALLKSLGG